MIDLEQIVKMCEENNVEMYFCVNQSGWPETTISFEVWDKETRMHYIKRILSIKEFLAVKDQNELCRNTFEFMIEDLKEYIKEKEDGRSNG